MVHSREDYEAAVEASNILFGKSTSESLKKLDEATLLDVFAGVPTYEIALSDLEKGIGILDLVAEKTSIFPSKGEARKMIQGNGFSLNKDKFTDVNGTVGSGSLLNGKYILAQKGKKNYFLLLAK